ncbi:MAG: HEAT repeat domain-containing protein [Armatimonadota bacterium]
MRDRCAQGLRIACVVATLALLSWAANGCRKQAEEPPPPPVSEQAEESEDVMETLEAMRQGQTVTLARFKEMLASPSATDRTEAVNGLFAVDDQSGAAQEVLRLLGSDPDYAVRSAAASALAVAFQSDLGLDPVPALAKAARDDSVGAVRAAAVRTLSQAEGPLAEETLQTVRASDSVPEVRNEALKALLALYSRQGPRGWRKLGAFLGDNRDDQSALAAIQFTVTGRRTVPVLIEILETSREGRQRATAAGLLATICAGRTETSREFGQRAKYLAGAPEKQDPPDLRAVEPLLKALEHDPYYPVREAAALGLGLLGDARAVEPLGRALSDEHMPVRRRAASALILLPATPVIPALAKCVRTDPSPAVRQFAVRALGWTQQPAAVDPLIDALRDGDSDVRSAAADFLGELGDERAVPPLTDLFYDEDVDVRWAAVRSAGKLGGEVARRALLDVYNDSRQAAQVVQAADDALRTMGHLVTYREADEEKLKE